MAEAGFVPQGHGSRRASTASPSLAAAAPTAPFTECPPVGFDTSCALLVDVTDGGVTILQDPSQGPYDGVEDTLIGLSNQSSKSLGHLSLGSNTDMFGFDGDGICSFEYTIDPGCPFGPTGYEGPGTSFTEISVDLSSGVVNFEPPIPPGGTSYFSLEEPLSASTVVSGGPSPIEQGGAPNGSERHTTCSKGHPVNCATGVLWHEFTDARVAGRGVPLEFTRTYSSINAAKDGPLGFGWSDSYGMSLEVDGETGAATVLEEGGSAVAFPSNGEGGFVTPPRVLARLEANEDGTYSFSRFADHVEYVFSAAGRLLREVDRNGNTTSLVYSGGLLEKVVAPSGRSLTFAYSGVHIHTISDPMGRTTTFGYGAGGDLTEATDPMGRTWHFSYGADHRLTAMTNPRGGTISNVYDGSGRVISQTDPMGRESTWSYQGEAAGPEGGTTTFTNGRGDVTRYSFRDLELRSVTQGFGAVGEATTSYQYDPITLGVTLVTDPNGGVTQNHYDGHGNLVETTDPLFRSTFYAYGPEDEVIYFVDPRGTPTEFRYDGAGNLLERETPNYETGEAAVTRYGYDDEFGDLTSATDPGGNTTTFGYDAAGDRSSATDPDGRTTTFDYNQDGELTAKVSPAGNEPGGEPAAHTTHYAYDADGELISETDQLGHATTFGYDGNGNQTTVTNANGHTTQQAYDADDEPKEVIRPDGSVLGTSWDAAGHMTAQVDAAGHATTYAYDALGRMVSMTDPNGHTTDYGYDPAGNRTSLTNADGELTIYEYDADNELISIYYTDGSTPSVFEEYDENGNRISLSDGSGTSTFTYDSLNRMTSAVDGSGETVEYEYDLAGNLTRLTYPNGESVTREFDLSGHLVSVTDWLGHTSRFSYDPDSNLSEEEFGNGDTAKLDYDDADRLTSIENLNGAIPLAGFTYTRDPMGQVTGESSENGEAATTGYSRNALDQLTAADSVPYGYDPGDNPTTFGLGDQHFDPANQLTSVSGLEGGEEEGEQPPAAGGGSTPGAGPAPGAGSPPASAPAPRKAHRCRKGFKKKKVHGKKRCVKAKKKRKGHRRARARASAQGASLAPATASTQSQGATLVASVEVSRHFAYDARGDRVSEELLEGGVRFLGYDQADHLVAVGNHVSYAYDGDGMRVSKTVDGVTTREVWNRAETLPELLADGATNYVYGPGGQPIEQITGGVPTFMHSDQQGSIRLLTDASGAAVGRYDYDAWGNVTRHIGGASSELQFNGQLTDAETGFQYLRARYYDPATGQFLTPDPLQPVSRSRYGYAENDPLTFGDASGELFGVDTLLGAGIGAIVGTVAGAGSYGVSVLTSDEDFSWRGLGSASGGGLVGGAAAGACEGTVWIAPLACGAAGGAIASGTSGVLSGHLPSAGRLLFDTVTGGAGSALGRFLYPLRGFLPYKLSNIYKPGINSLRMYAQNAVGGLTGVVAELLWC